MLYKTFRVYMVIIVLIISIFILIPSGIAFAETDDVEKLRDELRDIISVSEMGIARFMEDYKSDVVVKNDIYTTDSTDSKIIAACKIVNPIYTVCNEARDHSNKEGSSASLADIFKEYIDKLGNAYDVFMIESEREYEKGDAWRLNELTKLAKDMIKTCKGDEKGYEELYSAWIEASIKCKNPESSLSSLSITLADAINRFNNPQQTILDKSELKKAIDEAEKLLIANRSILTTDEKGEYQQQEAATLYSTLEKAKLVFMNANSDARDVGEAIAELSAATEAFATKAESLGDELLKAEENLQRIIIAAMEQLQAALDDKSIAEVGDRFNSKYANDVLDMIDIYTKLLESGAKTAEMNEAYASINGGMKALSSNLAARAALNAEIENAKACQNNIVDGYYSADNRKAINEKIAECEQLLKDYTDEPTTASITNNTNTLKACTDEFKKSITTPASAEAISKLRADIDSAYSALETAVKQGKLKLNTSSVYENNNAQALFYWLENTQKNLPETLTEEYINGANVELAKLLKAFTDDMNLLASYEDKAALMALIEHAKQLLANNASQKGNAQGIDLQNMLNQLTPLGIMTKTKLIEAEEQLTAKMNAFSISVADSEEKIKEAKEMLEKLRKSAKKKLDDAHTAKKISTDSNGDFVEPEANNLDKYILWIDRWITDIQTLEEMNNVYDRLTELLKDFEDSLDKVDNNALIELRKALEDIIKDAKEKGIISVDASGDYIRQDIKKLLQILNEAEAMLEKEDPDQSKLKQLYSDILAAKAKLEQYVKSISENREALSKEIEKAEKLLAEALDSGKIHQSDAGYSDEAANKLLQIVKESKELIKKSDAELSDFTSVTERIKAAIEEFTKSHPEQNGLVMSALSAELVNAITAIEAAEKGWTKYPDGALDSMKAELKAAQQAMEDAKNQQEIDAALERLKNSLDTFLNKQLKDGQMNNDEEAGTLENHLVSGWQNLDGKLYYYEDGYRTTKRGWLKQNNIWYYINEDAAAATGWLRQGGRWYYLQPDSGQMQTGWLKLDGKWYYLNANGDMKTGWLKDNGKWYYLKASGAMATGWEKVGGTWYYMEQSGNMKTGWLKDNGKWYYLKGSGAMATGWIKINTNWYYHYENGTMAENTWVGIYRVNSDGAWLK